MRNYKGLLRFARNDGKGQSRSLRGAEAATLSEVEGVAGGDEAIPLKG
jgi:hypothetical protein